MSTEGVYAPHREVVDLRDCDFYHTMDIPGYGHVEGQWDLRGREAQYLGGVQLKGKRVLEVGTASGHLCLYMERQGAEVVAYDLSPEQQWDLIPYSCLGKLELQKMVLAYKNHIRRLNDGWWLAHNANRSKANVAYGSVYSIPREIGLVQISTFGSVLLHVRDPFLALQRAASLTTETMVVAEANSRRLRLLSWALRRAGLGLPLMAFAPPDPKACVADSPWWRISPNLVQSYLAVLGFEKSTVTYATLPTAWGRGRTYTVVAHRTDGERHFSN